MSEPLWTFDELVAATGGRPVGARPRRHLRHLHRQPHAQAGRRLLRHQGRALDGHDFVSRALAGGAARRSSRRSRLPALGRITGSLVVVDDVLEALRGLGRGRAGAQQAKIIAVTGSVGKTSTKEMLASALAAAARCMLRRRPSTITGACR